VLAVALACWWGEMVYAPVIEDGDEQPFDAWSPEALRTEWERGHRVKPQRVESDGGADYSVI
jgi:hypothetical protein